MLAYLNALDDGNARIAAVLSADVVVRVMDYSARAGMADSKFSFRCELWFMLRVDWGGVGAGSWLKRHVVPYGGWVGAGRNAVLYHMVQYGKSVLLGIAIHCHAFSRIVHGIVLYGLILLIALSDIVGIPLSRIVVHCCIVIVAHCSNWHCRALLLSHCCALSRIPKLTLSRIHYI